MSRAVVTCSRLGRPEALRNTVCDMPSWRALLVIICAKEASSPPSASASTTAASLAERVTSAIVASRTLTVPPGGRPILVGGALSALIDTGRPSPSDRRPEFERREGEVDRHQLGERRRMAKLVGLIGRELAPARGVEDDVGVAAIDRGIAHPARGGGRAHGLGLAGRRGAFLRRRLRIGVGRQESGNKEERCGKQGEAGRDAT